MTLQVDTDIAHLSPRFVQGNSSLTLQLKRRPGSPTVRLHDMLFTSALPTDTTFEVQQTAFALELLHAGVLSSRIWVLEETFRETARMTMSQSDALLLFRQVEVGQVYLGSLVNEERNNAEQVLRRLVPIWILNHERAWTVQNAARRTVRVLRNVSRFFRSVLTPAFT